MRAPESFPLLRRAKAFPLLIAIAAWAAGCCCPGGFGVRAPDTYRMVSSQEIGPPPMTSPVAR